MKKKKVKTRKQIKRKALRQKKRRLITEAEERSRQHKLWEQQNREENRARYGFIKDRSKKINWIVEGF